jgi:hypothetical protein
MDNDGRSDIVVSKYDDSRLHVRTNGSSPAELNLIYCTNKTTLQGLVEHPYAGAVGDVDGDNKADVVVPGYGATLGSIIMFKNNSTSPGRLSLANGVSIGSAHDPRQILLMDANGDGRPDLPTVLTETHRLRVYRNISSSGNPQFAPYTDARTQTIDLPIGLESIRPVCVAANDIDGDGTPDLLVGTWDPNDIIVVRVTR